MKCNLLGEAEVVLLRLFVHERHGDRGSDLDPAFSAWE